MSDTNYITKLGEALDNLPINVAKLFGDNTPMGLLEDVGDFFELSLEESGEIEELVRQVITKEREPKDFEVGLVEKLEEENKEKVPEIVAVISEAIFSRLLPALNIKVPIELAVRVAPPKVEGLEIAPLAPAHPTVMKRMAPPSASVPPPPVMRSTLHQAYVATPTAVAPKPQSKPPIMEGSHESMSINPLESLMQMLEGKVSPKDLSRQFERLPESLKNALGSVDSAKKVVDIGRKYALHMDKLGELGAETGMVILGFTHPAQFLSRLTKRLGLSEEKVRPIAQEINTEVFLKIREALKVVHGENEEPKGPTVTTAPIPIKPLPSKLSSYDTGRLGGQASEPPLPSSPSSLGAFNPAERVEDDISAQSGLKPSPSELSSSDTGKLGGQATEPDEVLDRDTILRDIENPTPVNSGFQALVAKTQTRVNPEAFVAEAKPVASIPSESKNIPIKPREQTQPVATEVTKGTPPRAIPISRPVPQKIPLETNFTPTPKIETVTPRASEPPVSPTRVTEEIPPRAVDPAPITPPPKPAPEVPPITPKNIVDQKLSGPTTSTASESNYTNDPYRESLG